MDQHLVPRRAFLQTNSVLGLLQRQVARKPEARSLPPQRGISTIHLRALNSRSARLSSVAIARAAN